MDHPNAIRQNEGPFFPEQIRCGDRYELDRGHPVYCTPGGGDHGVGSLLGGQVLATDPGVDSAGIDVGYKTGPKTLRAPDVAVGGVPDAPGWVDGAPPLAVEYAASGQDEEELQARIAELIDAGTRVVWVVRLAGPRRVEVYEAGQPPRVRGPGDVLEAPWVLENPVPVEGLYDRNVAFDLMLRNLLQRQGYEDLSAVREEGRQEGRQEGKQEGSLETLRDAVLSVLVTRGVPLAAGQQARVRASSDANQLQAWLASAAVADSAAFLDPPG